MANDQVVTLRVTVALPTVERLDGEAYGEYQARVQETAVKRVRESLVSDHRLTVVDVSKPRV